MKKKNYLNNKDLLHEIEKSKNSFCCFIDERYSIYDGIVDSKEEITQEYINSLKEHIAQKKSKQDKTKKYTKDDIPTEGIVIRAMEHDHIPYGSERKQSKAKKPLDEKVKTNFPPFKHYYIYADEDGNLLEINVVGKSHWKNGVHNGEFDQTHGHLTENLASMLMHLVERLAQKGNWRGYSYIEEMKGQAIVQLIQVVLQFNEKKSDNPFAYITSICNNSFLGVLNFEKKNQKIRDTILEENNLSPSYTRQNEDLNDLNKG